MAALCASVAVLCTGPLTGRRGRGGVIARGASPRFAARAAGSAAGECWSGVESDRAYVLDPSKNNTHRSQLHSHSVYGLYVGSTTITAICKSGPRSLLIG